MLGQAERLLELRRMKTAQGGKREAKIIAFTSGKGGTGKTFVSLNIAYSLSKQNKKILFIDLDSNLSNANIMINVVAKKTIYDYFVGKSILADLIFEYEPNLHFIFGDSGKTDYPKSRTEQINGFFSQMYSFEKNYDYIILDTGAGANEEIISILSNSDCYVITTAPEPTAVMDAYVIIKLLNFNQYGGKKLIVVNKCIELADGESTYNNLASASSHFLKEKLELLGTIDYDAAVGKAVVSQELYIKKNPRSKISAQIFKMSKDLHEIIQLANIHHSNSSGK